MFRFILELRTVWSIQQIADSANDGTPRRNLAGLTRNYLLDYGSGFQHKFAMAQKKEAPTPAPPPEPPPTKAG